MNGKDTLTITQEVGGVCELDEPQRAYLYHILISTPAPFTEQTARKELVAKLCAAIQTLQSGIFDSRAALAQEREFIGSIQIRTLLQENEELKRKIEGLEAGDREWPDAVVRRGCIPTPEDRDIDAAGPWNNGDGDVYTEAMRMVSARHSKASLVALVNWLLASKQHHIHLQLAAEKECVESAERLKAMTGGNENTESDLHKQLRRLIHEHGSVAVHSAFENATS